MKPSNYRQLRFENRVKNKNIFDLLDIVCLKRGFPFWKF